MSRRRVVVTGLGCISPVGNTVADAWANLLAGKSGIANITRFDASAINCHFAGEVKDLDLDQYIAPKEARAMDKFIHYGIAAAVQAVQDSGLATGEALSEEEATRIGVVIGSGIGGLPLIEDMHSEYLNKGARRISPFFVPASIINMISGHVSMRYGFKGPNLAVVTACTTGLPRPGPTGIPCSLAQRIKSDTTRKYPANPIWVISLTSSSSRAAYSSFLEEKSFSLPRCSSPIRDCSAK